MSRLNKITALPALVLCCLFAGNAFAQTYLETYGQNRIQLRSFPWKVFETPHFFVYHYDRSGKDLARYVAEQAETDFALAAGNLPRDTNEKYHIIVYNSFDDYKQTNVGRSNDATPLRSTNSGSVDIPEDRIVVYFTGVHTDLQKQIREGIARALTEEKTKGGSFGSMARAAATTNIPEWLEEGFTQYNAKGWPERTDNEWKGLVEGYPKKKFFAFTETNGALAGTAFWKYVRERYGLKEVKALMSAIKLRGNMNKALKARYKLNVVHFFDSCLTFYKDAYAENALDKQVKDSSGLLASLLVPAPGVTIRNILVSPRGADIAYTRLQNGTFQVVLKHTSGEQEESVILEGGEKNYNEIDDPNYPLLAWSNTGYQLSILYKKGNGLRLRIYDATKGKVVTYVVPNNRFDRALGMAIDEDNNGIILSAIRKSQIDLYFFSIKGSRMRNLTNDVWDDVQPAFVTGGRKRGIAFLSNRPVANMNAPSKVNELPTGPMNVFFYDTKTKSPYLLRCSNAAEGETVTRPTQFGPDNFAYISDAGGTRNKYVVVFGRDAFNRDSMFWIPATNYANSLESHQYNPAGNIVVDILRQGKYFNAYASDLSIPTVDYPAPAVKPARLVEDTEDNPLAELLKPEQRAPASISRRRAKRMQNNIDTGNVRLEGGNVFRSEFSNNTERASELAETNVEDTANAETAADEMIALKTPDSTFIKMKAVPYRTAFRTAQFSVSLDNNVLFNRYQPASANGNSFANPQIGALTTIALDDLMENYRITGGFKLPFGGPGSSYFLQFENTKRRVDWNLVFFRTSNTRQYNINFVDSLGNSLFNTVGVGKTVSNLLQAGATYPLDKMRSFRMTAGVRQDVMRFKAIDTFTLMIEPEQKYWTMSRLEYVYDNSKLVAANIRNGLRYKIFAEYMYQMNAGGGGLHNFGFDVRNYVKIYKNFIWALRLAAAHSGGKQKILYYLGGTDNWLNYQAANPAAPVTAESYGFQTQANNLRGYKQNARNGNSYALINSEFRLPLLTSFIRRPIQSKILRSLQLVGFTDLGMAWNGLFPSEANMTKQQVLQQQPLTVTLNIPSLESVSIGYGAGLRLAASGYEFRLDAAWSKMTGPKPIWYFSLGTDF